MPGSLEHVVSQGEMMDYKPGYMSRAGALACACAQQSRPASKGVLHAVLLICLGRRIAATPLARRWYPLFDVVAL